MVIEPGKFAQKIRQNFVRIEHKYKLSGHLDLGVKGVNGDFVHRVVVRIKQNMEINLGSHYPGPTVHLVDSVFHSAYF